MLDYPLAILVRFALRVAGRLSYYQHHRLQRTAYADTAEAVSRCIAYAITEQFDLVDLLAEDEVL